MAKTAADVEKENLTGVTGFQPLSKLEERILPLHRASIVAFLESAHAAKAQRELTLENEDNSVQTPNGSSGIY
jgi:hypothetical protein